MNKLSSWIIGLMLVAVLLGVSALVGFRLLKSGSAESVRSERPPAPVEAAPVGRGTILDQRVFSGTLEASARVTVAPKVAGRIASLPVDLADSIERGQIVARLDGDEYEQAVLQAEAELAVARAGLAAAESAGEIAERELERVRTLHGRGVASDSQLDTAIADELAKRAAVEVGRAELTRSEAMLSASRIRLGYVTIRADWDGGDERRVVAERFVEEGDTVAANTPLLSIIDLDPIRAIVFATERDYAQLAPGQPVTLRTDAYSDREWSGSIDRISPAFDRGSRQARVEISVPNEGALLKPGMFVRVDAVLGRAENATIVPADALTQRNGETVVFVVSGTTVRSVPVRAGIRNGALVQITPLADDTPDNTPDNAAASLIAGTARVVTLGQQLIGDGSEVRVTARGGE